MIIFSVRFVKRYLWFSGLQRADRTRKRQEEKLERVTGIGPVSPAWKAGTLPLSYTRVGSHFIKPKAFKPFVVISAFLERSASRYSPKN